MTATDCKTGMVLFSYVTVHEPKAMNEGDTPKYSTGILIPKSDKETIKRIKAASKAGHAAGVDKFGKKFPKEWTNPLRDGDEKTNADGDPDEVYAGHWYLTASSYRKPSIVDKDLQAIMDEDEFYSGCYGRAFINFYPFLVPMNKGVACGLNALQKLKDGEALGGGGVSASTIFDDDFEFDEDDELF